MKFFEWIHDCVYEDECVHAVQTHFLVIHLLKGDLKSRHQCKISSLPFVSTACHSCVVRMQDDSTNNLVSQACRIATLASPLPGSPLICLNVSAKLMPQIQLSEVSACRPATPPHLCQCHTLLVLLLQDGNELLWRCGACLSCCHCLVHQIILGRPLEHHKAPRLGQLVTGRPARANQEAHKASNGLKRQGSVYEQWMCSKPNEWCK